MVHNTSDDHRDREPEKEHRVNKTQLLGGQAKLISQLRKNTRPDTERKGRRDNRKTTGVKKPAAVNGLSHKTKRVDNVVRIIFGTEKQLLLLCKNITEKINSLRFYCF
jgi:hypothetical protein